MPKMLLIIALIAFGGLSSQALAYDAAPDPRMSKPGSGEYGEPKVTGRDKWNRMQKGQRSRRAAVMDPEHTEDTPLSSGGTRISPTR